MDDRRLFYLIHRVHTKFIHAADQYFLEQLEITSVQLMALFYIRENKGCLLKELGEGIWLKSSAITGLVQRMEKKGLILKHNCAEDARGFRLNITEEGEKIALQALPMIKKLNAVINGGFSDDELDVVFRFLHLILERMSNFSSLPCS